MRKTIKYANRLLWGLEKESLRINRDGSLSDEYHPASLEPPFYTRDFAESQLEIITPPRPSIESVLSYMAELTGKAEGLIKTQLLWPLSIPPENYDDSRINIADFISNPEPGMNIRKRNEAVLYRKGLALRYGRQRQLISGVHVNFSLERKLLEVLYADSGSMFSDYLEFSNQLYTAIAAFLFSRLWFISVFSAASPVGQYQSSGNRNENMLSYRNSPYGYAGRKYREYLDLRSWKSYLNGIMKGMKTESEIYHFLGLVHNGRRTQINSNVFQNHKEFYSPVRLKWNPEDKSRNISHLEMRIFDLDPYTEAGIHQDVLRLIHMLVVFWLDSRDFQQWKKDPFGCMKKINDGLKTAFSGLDQVNTTDAGCPGESGILMKALSEINNLRQAALVLDSLSGDKRYSQSLHNLSGRLEDPRELLSIRIFNEYLDSGMNWKKYGLSLISRVKNRQEENNGISYTRI